MNTMRRLNTLVAGVLVLACSGVAGSAETSTAQAPAIPATQKERPPESDDNYVIGPGDSLLISVWRYPDLTYTITVRPDGKISLPLVENMVARDKTPSALARDVEVVLDERGVREPVVSVIVTQAISVNSKVQVTGAVKQNLSIPYYKGLKVLDLIEKAGLSEFASPNKAHIAREVGGKMTKIPVKLGELQNKGELKWNLELQPGDVLIVPTSFW